MISFDKFVARDLVERGVRLALDNPQQVITIEFNELDLYIELVLDERDRNDHAFVDSLPDMALSNIERKLAGLEPRLVTVKRYSRLVLRG